MSAEEFNTDNAIFNFTQSECCKLAISKDKDKWIYISSSLTKKVSQAKKEEIQPYTEYIFVWLSQSFNGI